MSIYIFNGSKIFRQIVEVFRVNIRINSIILVFWPVMAPVATATSANSAIICRTDPRATTVSISLASSLGNEIGAKLMFAQFSDITQYSVIERPAATLVGEDALGRVSPFPVGASWVGQTPVAFLAPPTNIAFAVRKCQNAIVSILLE